MHIDDSNLESPIYCAKRLHIGDLNPLFPISCAKRLHIGGLNLLGDGVLRDYTLGI